MFTRQQAPPGCSRDIVVVVCQNLAWIPAQFLVLVVSQAASQGGGKRWDTQAGKAAEGERGSLGDASLAVRHLQLMQLVSQCVIPSLLSCVTHGLAVGAPGSGRQAHTFMLSIRDCQV